MTNSYSKSKSIEFRRLFPEYHMHNSKWLIGSGNGFLPSVNKPLHEQTLAQICVTIWPQWVFVCIYVYTSHWVFLKACLLWQNSTDWGNKTVHCTKHSTDDERTYITLETPSGRVNKDYDNMPRNLAWSCKHLYLLCLPDQWNLPVYYCLSQWISKLPGNFEIYWVRQYLVNDIVLFEIKNL